MTRVRSLTVCLAFLLASIAEAAEPAEPTAESGGQMSLTLDECYELNDLYVAALAEARQCNPDAHRHACTLPAATSLICPCWTVVDDFNREALAAMAEASFRFGAGSCGSLFECGAALCPQIRSVTCEPVDDAFPHGQGAGLCFASL